MERKDWNRIGLAAAVVLLPGGFVLGAALAARWLRAQAAESVVPPAESETEPPPERDALS